MGKLGGGKGSKCLDGRQRFVHIFDYHEITVDYQCPISGHFLVSVGSRNQLRLVLAKSSEIYSRPRILVFRSVAGHISTKKVCDKGEWINPAVEVCGQDL